MALSHREEMAPVAAPAPALTLGRLLPVLALAVVLLAGAYFRFVGLMWGDYAYPHPDERFLVWVVADIAPVEDAGDYFDTANSTLNPANRGHVFFVYGDLPVILTRYATGWFFEDTGWDNILKTGRGLSALLDLLTVMLVFLILERLAGWKVAAVGGLLSAASVLPIQQSHFFTSDTFSTFFTTLAIYIGVLLVSEPDGARPNDILKLCLWYGLAVGLAMSCKINTALVAFLLPAALILRLARLPRRELESWWPRLLMYAFAAGGVALLVFRLGQPYAFSGPGFFDISIDDGWIDSIRELATQSAGDVDFPPALQWADRNHLFSLKNMVLWGLGLPLGIVAWAGFFLFAVRAFERLRAARHKAAAVELNGEPLRIAAQASPVLAGGTLRSEAYPVAGGSFITVTDTPSEATVVPPGEDGRGAAPWQGGLWGALSSALLQGPWPGVLLVWLWTAAYFTWQSMAWNPTMRYQLPVYPTLVVLAAWGLGNLWAQPRLEIFRLRPRRSRVGLWRVAVSAAGVLVVLLTLSWAFAFTRIYTRPESRVAASRWIFENIPGPVNLEGQSADGASWRQLLAINANANIQGGQAYTLLFDNTRAGVLSSITIENMQVITTGRLSLDALRLRARLVDPRTAGEAAQVIAPFPAPGKVERLELAVKALPGLDASRRYGLLLDVIQAETGEPVPESDISLYLNGAVKLNLYERVDTTAYQDPGEGMANLMLPKGGMLRQMRFPAGTQLGANEQALATVIVKEPLSGEQQVATGVSEEGSPELLVRFEPPVKFEPGVNYLVAITSSVPVEPGQALELNFFDRPFTTLLPDLAALARPDAPLVFTFTAHQDAQVSRITLPRAAQLEFSGAATGLTLSFFGGASVGSPLQQVQRSADLTPAGDARGQALIFELDAPVSLVKNEIYSLTLAPDRGALAVRGVATANESTWDMGLPFRQDNYDPYGGIYRGDLNFEMYWDDKAEKRDRFLNILDQADYIFMSSNRQWGTTTRLPMRHPLTTEFYRRLLGCPADKEVEWCYRVAEVGMFQGELGFDLVRVETSYPNLGPLRINDQFAEEAFTVYDHAKVMIFQKRADYNPAQAQAALGRVDLSKVIHVTPKKAGDWKDLMLPSTLWAVQQAGGTWSALFPPEGLHNRYPAVGLGVFYLFLLLLGVLTYPLVRLALPGLADKGYPLARIAGLVIFGYLAWILGSLGVPVTRGLLAAIFAVLALVGIGLGFLQRAELREEWRGKRGYFLSVELVALVLFAIDLLIRLGNPDLWHLYYGGEKPMDFSFFNAVLKSTVFPPYDPWFAGGYINYYYYGYVIVGMPVKLLGITPSVAYNLILPALFSMVGLGAFSVGWNLLEATRKTAPAVLPAEDGVSEGGSAEPESEDSADSRPPRQRRPQAPFLAGLAAVTALLLLGNLGTVRMFWQGFQNIVVSTEEREAGNVFQQIGWAAQGIGKLFTAQGTALPYSEADWYWKPSRAIQPEAGNEITEFPFFTFLYADLHAHLMALPVTLLVVAWALGMVLGKGRWGLADGRWRKCSLALALLLGALAAGALRPANTWDQYTYLTLAALLLAYSQWTAKEDDRLFGARWLNALAPTAVLVGLALLLYAPFDTWFGQGYNALEIWKNQRTGLGSYLVHWGLFLFVIATWLFDEAVDWMAATPVSALRKLSKYGLLGAIFLLLALIALLALLVLKVWVALIVVPLGLWVVALLFRPDLPDAKRFVLFLTGTALLLTLAVELVAVKGDIGRMNTVFKFYYQAWAMLSLSAAAALAWLWGKLRGWHYAWSMGWLVVLGLLVAGAALYPLTAAQGKINDRMAPDAPHTLDGMAYMQYARLLDGQDDQSSIDMDLSQDYRAIRWMQQNVPGSPVIVEANTPEYRHWGTRGTIYPGRPGVVGGNWHERQQRAVTPDYWVFDRIDEITAFYQTTDPDLARAFLDKYNVQYILFGQVEKAWYPGPGLDKFEQYNGVLWDKVYEEGMTAIYKVKR